MNDSISKIKRFFADHHIVANLLLIFMVACILVWGALLFLDSWTNHGSSSTVPPVKGLSFEQARLTLAENDLTRSMTAMPVPAQSWSRGRVPDRWSSRGARFM